MIKVNGKYKSCNFSPRPLNTQINTLVIHHTDMTTAQSAIDRLCDKNTGVSSHYVIDQSGEIYYLVNNTDKAFHAGASSWRGIGQVNDYSIGIELDNNGTDPFSEKQMQSLIALAQQLMQEFPIEKRNIVAHADIAPNRKVDPHHHFNWKLLADDNVGIYPDVLVNDPKVLYKYGMNSDHIGKLKKKLSNYGYLINNPGNEFDRELLNVVHTFKRHFSPETYHHTFWDSLAEARLDKLLSMA
jgi:N-acetylmuramoyl-L-alanine amidase